MFIHLLRSRERNWDIHGISDQLLEDEVGIFLGLDWGDFDGYNYIYPWQFQVFMMEI